VHGPSLYVVGFLAALVISMVASPAGVSGAVLLLPFQVSVLGTPSPAVTPTNLLYNVVATPGALYRYWRQGQTGGSLTALLLAGTVPGVVAGSVLRVEFLPGPGTFEVVIAVVLVPLGSWLVAGERLQEDALWMALTTPVLVGLAAIVGVVGGIYGRVYPGPTFDRCGSFPTPGRPSDIGFHLCHFGRRGRDVHCPVSQPPRVSCPFLGNWCRIGPRWAAWWLYRRLGANALA